jgi:hypothetical protein
MVMTARFLLVASALSRSAAAAWECTPLTWKVACGDTESEAELDQRVRREREKYRERNILELQLWGERHSGTNFLTQLVRENFNVRHDSLLDPFGFKHMYATLHEWTYHREWQTLKFSRSRGCVVESQTHTPHTPRFGRLTTCRGTADAHARHDRSLRRLCSALRARRTPSRSPLPCARYKASHYHFGPSAEAFASWGGLLARAPAAGVATVVLVREPLAWLLALRAKPHPPRLEYIANASVAAFLRDESAFAPFGSVLAMRSAKLRLLADVLLPLARGRRAASPESGGGGGGGSAADAEQQKPPPAERPPAERPAAVRFVRYEDLELRTVSSLCALRAALGLERQTRGDNVRVTTREIHPGMNVFHERVRDRQHSAVAATAAAGRGGAADGGGGDDDGAPPPERNCADDDEDGAGGGAGGGDGASGGASRYSGADARRSLDVTRTKIEARCDVFERFTEGPTGADTWEFTRGSLDWAVEARVGYGIPKACAARARRRMARGR